MMIQNRVKNLSLIKTIINKTNVKHHTLQLNIFPKAENVSYMALLSILLSKFLMNTLPTPDFLREGSL